MGGPAGAGYLTVKRGALVKVRFPLGNLVLLCNFVIGLIHALKVKHNTALLLSSR